MTLLAPLALLGLLLVPGLVALHLRRHQMQTIEIPSLLLWENAAGEIAPGGKYWRLEHLFLLLLQALALCVLVFALAQPAGSTVLHQRVYVLDEGALMTAADPAPSRFVEAQRLIQHDMETAPAHSSFVLIAAGGQPYVAISTTSVSTAVQTLHDQRPSAARADLRAAIGLAAGLVTASGHMTVVYADGEVLPAIAAARGTVSTSRIGTSTDDQGIARLTAQCQTGATACNAFATVHNGAASTVDDTLTIEADGTVLGQQTLHMPADSDTDLSFHVPTSRHVLELLLSRHDLVPSDNLAWAVLPASRPTSVTIVGTAKITAPLARAFAAIPDVHAVVRTPAQFTKAPPAHVGLLVLAGWIPARGLPDAPGILLVNPPRLLAAAARSAGYQAVVSGMNQASPLLQGVDLTSLDIPPGASELLQLPSTLQPIVWSPEATLLAAGTLDGRQLVVMTVDPTLSNLDQLAAFPLLMGNILQWWNGWAPATATPAETLTVDVPPATSTVSATYVPSLGSRAVPQAVALSGASAGIAMTNPGVYTIAESGSWGTRSAQVAVSGFAETSDDAATPAISVPSYVLPAAVTQSPLHSMNWWPWLGLLAGLIIALEWLGTRAGIPQRE